ncbi:hypothetical protein EXIGLDRAFT_763804 [Exidia glandulosa HHB12029]|uniref:DUF6534 domain-containing protein n=1 Tax=Exidia glandulosa HHB12029 TaxID=1314781 RepID=A0A165LPA3_EXIGL|nr:hypothetical protein EXIGLDRAFT_763804 [Exidia glandulosa HHB12029]
MAAPGGPTRLPETLYTYQTTTEVGILLSSVLFGIFIAQLYQYFTSSKSEPVQMKCFGAFNHDRALRLYVELISPEVVFIALIETTHTVSLWVYLVDMNHGSILQPGYLILDTFTIDLALLMSGIVGAVVQSFYAYRISRFSGSFWLGIPSWTGSVVRVGITVAGCVTALRGFSGRHTITDWITKFSWVLGGVLASSTVVDLVNTIILCIILSRHRNSGTRTSRVIDKLTVWAIETGMLTSILAVSHPILGRVELLPAFLHVYPNMFSLSLLLS